MTRAELIKVLSSEYTLMSCNLIESSVKSVFEYMSEALSNGERIELRGFGSFSLRYRQPRTARNPRTGETLTTEHRFSVHFKPGKELKERVNICSGAASAEEQDLS